ncbi:unnamed protein product [Coccothraustes coccothraustes]
MKRMILCESNIIQKHKEEGGKEILEAGGSVAFANTAQKRMEFGNGSQRRQKRKYDAGPKPAAAGQVPPPIDILRK